MRNLFIDLHWSNVTNVKQLCVISVLCICVTGQLRKAHTKQVSLDVDRIGSTEGLNWFVHIWSNSSISSGNPRLHRVMRVKEWTSVGSTKEETQTSGRCSGQDVRWNKPRLSLPLCISRAGHGVHRGLWALGVIPPGIRTSTSCCPLLSLHSAASVKTPHAPCINAVIRHQHVKGEFFLCDYSWTALCI